MTTTSTRTANVSATPPDGQFRGAAASVDPELVRVEAAAGRFRAGVLYGVSLIAGGEALGHHAWIDDTALRQVEALGIVGKAGIKSRFTHPGASSDGLGRHLGRIHQIEYVDDRVVGDLHFAKSAHATPDGDLAGYVMELAGEDPAAAGLSIVFDRDDAEETAFALEHGAALVGSEIDWTGFKSPDPDNVHNYPHIRIDELRAADVVDEPAANPAGLFDRQTEARTADAFLAYVLQLTNQRPAPLFGIDPDRASSFLSRWLQTHQLTIAAKGAAPMSNAVSNPTDDDQVGSPTPEPTPEPAPAPPSDPAAVSMDQLGRYVDTFGAERGAALLRDGQDFTSACVTTIQELRQSNETLQADLEAAQSALREVKLGETADIDQVLGDQSGKKTMEQFIHVPGDDRPSRN